MALETAIRTLGDWKREGIIDIVARMVDIRDVTGMQAVAGRDECLFDCSVFGPPIDGRRYLLKASVRTSPIRRHHER